MVVDGDLDVVFPDQLLEQGEVVVGRLADDDTDAHLAGEVEDPAHALFGFADVDDAVTVERDSGRFEGVLGESDLFGGHRLVEAGAGELSREGLAGEGLDRGDAQLLEHPEGLDEGELAERPGLRGEGELFDADARVVRRGDGLLELGRDMPDLQCGRRVRRKGQAGRRGENDGEDENGGNAFHGVSFARFHFDFGFHFPRATGGM